MADKLRHEEKLDRITGLTAFFCHEFIRLRSGQFNTNAHRFCFSQLGVLGKLCSESKLSTQRLAFGHRCILKCPLLEAGENDILMLDA